jgi:hypothetical protein
LIDIFIYNPCLLTIITNNIFGVVGIQTDNTIILRNKCFSAQEKQELNYTNYTAKPKEKLLVVTLLLFNNCVFSLDGANINLRQKG